MLLMLSACARDVVVEPFRRLHAFGPLVDSQRGEQSNGHVSKQNDRRKSIPFGRPPSLGRHVAIWVLISKDEWHDSAKPRASSLPEHYTVGVAGSSLIICHRD